MIKRVYSYYGVAQASGRRNPFCGTIEVVSWFGEPRKAWAWMVNDIRADLNCEVKDIEVISFNRL